MKKLLTFLAALAFVNLASAEYVAYKVTISLKVPRVYDNTQSLGYRKIQTQRIVGYVFVDKDSLENGEPVIIAQDFVNNTHKVQNKKVTYGETAATGVMWRYIGSNKTGVFRNANVKFTLDLDPSYNIGDDEPDNALIITLSCNGATDKRMMGYVTGQIGCGCKAYGHTSPTRTVDGKVSDIVPLRGVFSMKQVSKKLYDVSEGQKYPPAEEEDLPLC